MTRRLGVLVGLLILAGAAPASAQSDLTIQSFNCPGGNTRCFRVHANTSTASLTINGDLIATGGYKVAYVYAHANYNVVSTNVLAPIAGTGPATINATGPLYQRPGYAGSIIGVSIAANTALTGQGAAHAEAMRFDGTDTVATALTAVIGAGLANTQYATTTQARGLDVFTATEGVGCRMSVATSTTPTTAMLVCTVLVVY